MKLKYLAALLAVALLGAIPAGAADMKQGQEDVRMIALEAETIQMKIQRLEKEIAKGQSKISMAELKKLEERLSEAKKILEQITAGGN